MVDSNADDSDVCQALLGLQERFASTMGLTLAEYKRLAIVLRTEELVTVLELVRRRRHASPYRRRAAERVRRWLNSPRSIGKPLDPETLKHCTPQWPIQFKIPSLQDAIESMRKSSTEMADIPK
jgi:hypothetical protein